MIKTTIMRTLSGLVGLATLIVLFALAGCGGGGGSSSLSGGTGTLAINMSDAPDPTITAINITVDRVQAHIGSQWVDIATTPATYNLFDLVQDDTLLGSATVPAGHYTQIRLFLSSATVTDSQGTWPVTIPSAARTGLKINVDADVPADQVSTILLDFNVDKSLFKTGNGQYRLQPVIPAVVKILSGTISGIASDGTNVLNNASVTATYTAGSNYPVGTAVNTSSSMTDGTFKVWALLPGTYSLTFSWTDPNNSATVKTATVNDVVVSANANTDVGTVTLS